jgi:hypothetical protein
MAFGALLTHLFLPHHTNNHRAKALHTDSLLFYALVFAVFNFGLRYVHRQMPDILGYATDIHVQQLLDSTNAQRSGFGLVPLTLNPQLSDAAARKATDMFAKGYWAHNSPAGSTPWDFISAAGYHYVVAGENLAKNYMSSQAVVDAWMASPTHKANLIKPNYRDVGFAVVNGTLNGEETTLVVQMFGSSVEAVAAKPVEKAPVVPAEAAEVAPITEKTVIPVVTTAPVVEKAAIPLTTPAPVAVVPADNFAGTFLGVSKRPAINIPTLTRDIVFVFGGVLLGVLLLDAWVVSRRKIVRVAGHNIAHFLFLSAIIIAAGSITRGSLI